MVLVLAGVGLVVLVVGFAIAAVLRETDDDRRRHQEIEAYGHDRPAAF